MTALLVLPLDLVLVLSDVVARVAARVGRIVPTVRGVHLVPLEHDFD